MRLSRNSVASLAGLLLAATALRAEVPIAPWTPSLPGSNIRVGSPQFSPDGTNLVFPAVNRLHVVPFHDGTLDWAKARYVGTNPDASTHRPVFGKDPNIVIGGDTRELTMWNLKKTARTPRSTSSRTTTRMISCSAARSATGSFPARTTSISGPRASTGYIACVALPLVPTGS